MLSESSVATHTPFMVTLGQALTITGIVCFLPLFHLKIRLFSSEIFKPNTKKHLQKNFVDMSCSMAHQQGKVN